MGSMYLSQIVSGLSGSEKNCSGAPEREVVRLLSKASGASEALAQYEVDYAVQIGRLRRSWCRC